MKLLLVEKAATMAARCHVRAVRAGRADTHDQWYFRAGAPARMDPFESLLYKERYTQVWERELPQAA